MFKWIYEVKDLVFQNYTDEKIIEIAEAAPFKNRKGKDILCVKDLRMFHSYLDHFLIINKD
jgi:hypothetical protein